MELNKQVLSIEQVQELIELGFDIRKYASMGWVTTNQEDFELNTLDMCKYLICIPTLTIGDIMEVLPERIIGDKDTDEDIPYYIHVDKNEVYYYSHYEDYIFTISKINIIDALLETLKWCIKEKHLAL